tara:strand:- start:4769 stop:5218 length:450 start_codon:yes stop_codon:yes gene_type:complete
MSSNNLSEDYKSLISELTNLKREITSVCAQVRSLEKEANKRFKRYKKQEEKLNKRGNKKPSGIAVPQKISSELSDFMGMEEGKEVARTEVTKYIIQYIKDNNLQDPTNNKLIKPDNNLSSLLDTNKEGKDVEVNYFNIQRFMNKHFIKK